MNICMIGIDHSTAGVKIREQFSFTALQAERAMQIVNRQPGVRGCVLLSTCNRMELYVSMEPCGISLPELLGKIRPFPGQEEEFKSYFKIRTSLEAVRHLFYLAAGQKSKIFGEDQILTQIKEAIRKARELNCTDTLLEVLFRQAITAGKEVKTKAPAAHGNVSAVHSALASIEKKGFECKGKKCLVIGNGQMGKLAAETLRDAGALVTVTVRQYRSGIVEIPKGCDRIHYGERYEHVPFCDLILSAIVSPNLTIRKEQLMQAREGHCRKQIFIDLAVPRDMEEEIAQLEGVTLYDIDAFQNEALQEELCARKAAAEQILELKLAEFKDWYECRDFIPRIRQVGGQAAEEICWRMGRVTGGLQQSQQEQVTELLKESSQKVVDKMLFALRDELEPEELLRCLEILERIRY